MSPAEHDAEARRDHLRMLRGIACPLCRHLGLAPDAALRGGVPPAFRLAWTGVSLACDHGHGWSSREALMDDVRRMCGVGSDQ